MTAKLRLCSSTALWVPWHAQLQGHAQPASPLPRCCMPHPASCRVNSSAPDCDRLHHITAQPEFSGWSQEELRWAHCQEPHARSWQPLPPSQLETAAGGQRAAPAQNAGQTAACTAAALRSPRQAAGQAAAHACRNAVGADPPPLAAASEAEAGTRWDADAPLPGARCRTQLDLQQPKSDQHVSAKQPWLQPRPLHSSSSVSSSREAVPALTRRAACSAVLARLQHLTDACGDATARLQQLLAATAPLWLEGTAGTAAQQHAACPTHV